MRTYKGALVTTDTFFIIPTGNEHSHAAFFFGTCACRPVSVFKAVENTYRQVVAFKTIGRQRKFLIEFGMAGHIDFFINSVGPRCGNIDLNNILKAFINSRIVLVNDFLAFFTVRFYYRFFQFFDS